ncbi:MAG: hypothetical protein ACJ8F3_11120 [Xanthobacteraceae bacterium]
MRTWLQGLTLSTLAVLLLAGPGRSADDWTFVSGKYAVNAADCKHLGKGQPFSKALAKLIEAEVLTREGITSARETHCRFRSSAKSADGKWKVKAQCEEMGERSPDLEDVLVTKNADGTLAVLAEDTFGPEALTFRLCR